MTQLKNTVHTNIYRLNYRAPSFLKVSLPQGLLVKEVKPDAGSQLFLPLKGPGVGILAPPTSYALPCSLISFPLLKFLSPPVTAPCPASPPNPVPPPLTPVALAACWKAF